MDAYIVINPIGVFALNEKGMLLDKVIFDKNPSEIAMKLISSDLTDEEKKLLVILKDKVSGRLISSKQNEIYEYQPNNIGEIFLRNNFRKVASTLKMSETELNKLLTEVGIELAKIKIKKAVKKDKIAIQVVNAIDELDKSINIFVARLRELYGLHFPEMEREVEKHEKIVKLISEYGLRENVKEFSELAKTSIGIDLSENDGEMLKEYATEIKNLYKIRKNMEKYLNSIMKEITPNFSELAGPLLAARLIAFAGGLDKLAKKSSSTIQLLGAEKALFRYLHGHGKSPKYGYLYLHPMIQKAPAKKRGKVARVLASKLTIAIKMDYYGEKDKSEELKKELKKKVESILKEAN